MLTNLKFKSVYNMPGDDVIRDFYCPMLRESINFYRVSCYFSAKAFSAYSEGLEFFAKNDNRYYLVISKDISSEDYAQIKKGYGLRAEIKEDLRKSLLENLSLKEEKNLSNLAFLIQLGIVDIKIAFVENGLFHKKFGIFEDSLKNRVCFHGSVNETFTGLKNNSENFTVMRSWTNDDGFSYNGINDTYEEFINIWNNRIDGVEVIEADKTILDEINRHNKGKIIIDEAFLADNAIIFDYDSGFVVYLNVGDIEQFKRKSIFKFRLKNKIKAISSNRCTLRKDISYLDVIKLEDYLSSKCYKFGLDVVSTSRYKQYIERINLNIDKRFKFGMALKSDLSRFSQEYNQFISTLNPLLIRKLRPQQSYDAFYMYSMKKSFNFSVPGSGKTASVLAVYAYLMSKGYIDKIIMVGPLNSFQSWVDEFKASFGSLQKLNLMNLHDDYKSSKERIRALQYDSATCNLILVNYESLPPLANPLINMCKEGNVLLVFDEIHKVKRIDGYYAKSALKIAKYSDRTIGLTGTPIPNSYLDLYNLLHILFHNEYKDFFNFSLDMLKNPSKNQISEINNRLKPFFCRTSKQQLKVPEANVDKIIKSNANVYEQRLFDIVVETYRNNKLALFIRLLQLESNPRLLLSAIDMDDFADVLTVPDEIEKIGYIDFTDEVSDLIEKVDITSKKQACIDEIKSLVDDNKPVVCWCILKDTINDLKQRLSDIGIRCAAVYGAVLPENRPKIIEDFKNGLYDVLITNPHTLAESVSLHSVAHDAVYFEYSYNLVHLLQSKDRIHRLGLMDGQYTQYTFIEEVFSNDGALYSMDEIVHKRLNDKEQVMLDAIESGELKPVDITEEDLAIIFKEL